MDCPTTYGSRGGYPHVADVIQTRGERRNSTSSTRAVCLWRSSRKYRLSNSLPRPHGTTRYHVSSLLLGKHILKSFLHMNGVEDTVRQDGEGILAVQFMSSRPHGIGVHV